MVTVLWPSNHVGNTHWSHGITQPPGPFSVSLLGITTPVPPMPADCGEKAHEGSFRGREPVVGTELR